MSYPTPITDDPTGVVPVVVVDAPTARGTSWPHLVCVSGDDLGRSFQIAETLVIGRAPGGAMLKGTDVSRRHAQLTRMADGYVLEDLGSANGTFVNGARMDAPTRLHVGDRIQIGNTVLVLAQHDELAERMHRIQRLEAMGTLAGGIAHDFNNALAVIVANLDDIEDAIPSGDANAREAFGAVRDATSSATALAKRLLRLGRSEPMTLGVVALQPIVTQTVTMARRRAKGVVEMAVDVPPALSVLGSYDELHQAILNLIYNACDAMPEGGTLRIAARPVTLDIAQAVAHQLPAAGDYIELRVADTGIGMDAATLARAFEPFFTTKPRGQGTGLGLAMIHGSIRRHGGAIDVESTPGRGTTFVIHLLRR